MSAIVLYEDRSSHTATGANAIEAHAIMAQVDEGSSSISGRYEPISKGVASRPYKILNRVDTNLSKNLRIKP